MSTSILFVHSKDPRYSLPLVRAVQQHCQAPVHVVDIFRGQRVGDTFFQVYLNDQYAMWLPPDIRYVPALFVPDPDGHPTRNAVHYGEAICSVLRIPCPFGGGAAAAPALPPAPGGLFAAASMQPPPQSALSVSVGRGSGRMTDEEVAEQLNARNALLRVTGGAYEQPRRPADMEAGASASAPAPFLPSAGDVAAPSVFSVAAAPPPPMGMPALVGSGLPSSRAPLRGLSL